jgi:hypothetical protein
MKREKWRFKVLFELNLMLKASVVAPEPEKRERGVLEEDWVLI